MIQKALNVGSVLGSKAYVHGLVEVEDEELDGVFRATFAEFCESGLDDLFEFFRFEFVHYFEKEGFNYEGQNALIKFY